MDIDTGAFGTVQYEFPDDQSKFSINGEDGTIRLIEVFNATADNKYNVVPITAFDNPDNRQLSFSTPSTVRVSRAKFGITIGPVCTCDCGMASPLCNIHLSIKLHVFPNIYFAT